ncbi:MAG: helix-turn-helix domain-containing protein [Prevotella sp.]|nr:helix-turn-helix domain-containing protein [Prevotella sp.]
MNKYLHLKKQGPQLMDLSRMRDILTPHLAQISENIFFNGELGMVHGDHTVFSLLMRQKPPFTINDHRFGIITNGEAHINFNLQDRHVTAGTLVYIGPGTIINPVRLSDDLRIFGIGLFADFPMPFSQGQMPSAFNGQVRDFQLPVDYGDINTARHILDTIWHVVHTKDYHRPTVTVLVAALMHHYDHLFRQQSDMQAISRSREQTIFDRFIQLVTLHCTEHHQISYYAERMCLTERYLSTVIRQTSGTTAKDWIDRALITRIKIELRHTDKSAAQIAEEMHFANPSFFSKYFRRLTGMTPLDYKNNL